MTADHEPSELERYLNQIIADQAIFRITVHCLLLRLARAGKGPELIQSIKDQVRSAIEKTKPSEEGPHLGQRQKQLQLLRLDILFGELEDASGLDEDSPSPLDIN